MYLGSASGSDGVYRMSRETFAIEWNIARAALKGILKLHPLTVQKWEADVLRFRLEELNEYTPREFNCWF